MTISPDSRATGAAMTGFGDRRVLNLRTGQLWAWPGPTKSARCRKMAGTEAGHDGVRSRVIGSVGWYQWHQTPTMTSDALITANAAMPGFKPSSSAASLVMDAVIVTVGETSIVTWVVVAPGLTVLIVPAIWLRAESFTK